MTDQRDTFIRGEGITLRALREEDLTGNWYGWFNDPDVTWFENKGFYPNTPAKQEAFFHAQLTDDSQVTFAVDANGVHIGNATLKEIDWIHRTAELGLVIGEKDQWDKGHGTEVSWLVTKYAFLTLNLNKINARIFAENERSLKAALRIGYRVEGEQAEQYYRHGKFHNVVLVGMTASQWRVLFGADDQLKFKDSRQFKEE